MQTTRSDGEVYCVALAESDVHQDLGVFIETSTLKVTSHNQQSRTVGIIWRSFDFLILGEIIA